jgi:hypothetical protein
MSIKQTVLASFIAIFLASMYLFMQPVVVSAESCGGVTTSIISCNEPGGDNADVKDTGLWGILKIALNILIAGVGVLALAGIIWGSILYTSAGGNPEQVKKAMGVFTNVVIGVVAFAGMWVLLNFLIPGGAFNNL